MKKHTMAIAVAIMLVIILSFTFVACNNTDKTPSTDNGDNSYTDDDTDKDTPPTDTSAYGKLTSDEKFFFDQFVNKIKLFKDPSSVRLISIKSYYQQSYFDIGVSAKNSFGGTTSEKYIFFTKNWSAPGVASGDENYGEFANSVFKGSIYTYDDITAAGNFNVDTMSAIAYPSSKNIDTTSYSVANINKAIIEYLEEQGWT